MKAASVYIAKADDEAPALLLPFLCCLVFCSPPPKCLGCVFVFFGGEGLLFLLSVGTYPPLFK